MLPGKMDGPHETVNRHSEIIRCACFWFMCLDEMRTSQASLASPSGRGGRAQRGRRGETTTIAKDNTQLEGARRLRREMTPHERTLWYLFLRKYPVKIYKQRIIGRFIVDFYCGPIHVT